MSGQVQSQHGWPSLPARGVRDRDPDAGVMSAECGDCRGGPVPRAPVDAGALISQSQGRHHPAAFFAASCDDDGLALDTHPDARPHPHRPALAPCALIPPPRRHHRRPQYQKFTRTLKLGVMNAAAGAHDHHQKDFLTTFFPPDQSHPEHDQHARNTDMYHNQMNSGSSQQHPSMMNLQQSHMQSPPVGLDVLELMAMQDRQGQSSSGQSGQPTTPQMLLEQQVRLNQLQQLQQLQNQIFQQQVCLISPLLDSHRAAERRLE